MAVPFPGSVVCSPPTAPNTPTPCPAHCSCGDCGQASAMTAFVAASGAAATVGRSPHLKRAACSSSQQPVQQRQQRQAAVVPRRRRRITSVTASAAKRAAHPQQQVGDGDGAESTARPLDRGAAVDEFVSWTDVEEMCARLAARLRSSNVRYDVLLAVTRGGLVPATLLAQALEMRTVLSATVMFYTDGGDQFFGMAEPSFLSFPPADALAGRTVLVVDDVWDSGRTATAVRQRVQRAAPDSVTVAVLHYKPMQSVVTSSRPDFYAQETDNWIVYPWELLSPRHSASKL
jgi:uncharacterized protein